jgi:hypothetical protein
MPSDRSSLARARPRKVGCFQVAGGSMLKSPSPEPLDEPQFGHQIRLRGRVQRAEETYSRLSPFQVTLDRAKAPAVGSWANGI